MPMAARGVYTAETKPYVFINQHTKVLVQGMTGKHVSKFDTKIPVVFSKLSRLNLYSRPRTVENVISKFAYLSLI